MNRLPGRVRKAISDRFPLVCHVVATVGLSDRTVGRDNGSVLRRLGKDGYRHLDGVQRSGYAVARLRDVIRYDRESLRRFREETFEAMSIASMHDADFAMSVRFAQVRKGAA